MSTTEYVMRPTRWLLTNHYLRVFPEKSQVPLGRVMDIHTEGMRLQTGDAIKTEKELSLSMELPANGGKQERVPLKACKIWSKTNRELGISETGFHITWPRGARPIIENLIAGMKRLAEAQIPRLGGALNLYRDALETLATSPTPALISEVLESRDAVQETLNANNLYASGMLKQVSNLDRKLKKQAKQITRTIKLHEWRASLNPSAEAWWWFLDQHLGWVWDLLPIVFIILALGFLVDIYPRIFSGGPNSLGTLAIFVGLVSTLIAAMGKKRQGGMFWNKVRLVFSVVLLVIVAGIWFSKPRIANHFREIGLKHFASANQERALSFYKRALAFNPNDDLTHFLLGVLYDKSQNFEKARDEYQTAVSNSEDDTTHGLAINNLARIYMVLKKDYKTAFSILEQYDAPESNTILNYYYQKNLGWANLGLNDLKSAKAHLKYAIDIDEISEKISETELAAAYCLLAKVSEEMGSPPETVCPIWDKCYRLLINKRKSFEEIDWYFTAKKKRRSSLCDNLTAKGG